MAEMEESDRSGDSEEEEEESSSDDEQQERPVSEARKDAIYNADGMHEKLEEFGWPDDLDWIQTCVINYPESGKNVDVNDDLVREMYFYTQGVEGAKEAYLKLQKLGVPFLRPPVFYAEMIKTDSHMLKIKDKLLHEKSKLEESDERRKARESKKFAKEVQAEKLKERAKRKKQDIESVKKWRKVRQKTGHAGDDLPPPIDFDGNSKNGRGSRGGGRDRSMSRQNRDAKFGFGGRKFGNKRNDAASSADESTFRANFKNREKGNTRGRGRGRGKGRR